MSVAAAMQGGKILEHDIKTFIGVSARARVEKVGSIARSMGKARRVIDLR